MVISLTKNDLHNLLLRHTLASNWSKNVKGSVFFNKTLRPKKKNMVIYYVDAS